MPEGEVVPVAAKGSAPSFDSPSPHPNGSTEHRDLHDLLRALQAMRMGDFSVRLASDAPGLMGKIADTFNDIASTNEHFAKQLEHVGQVVGKDGQDPPAPAHRRCRPAPGAAWRTRSTRSSTTCSGRRPR